MCRAASVGAISFSRPTTWPAVRAALVTGRAPDCISSFARSPSFSISASALLLTITDSKRSSCGISGELLDVHDHPAIDQARRIRAEHRKKWRSILVEIVDEPRAVGRRLGEYRAGRRRAV